MAPQKNKNYNFLCFFLNLSWFWRFPTLFLHKCILCVNIIYSPTFKQIKTIESRYFWIIWMFSIIYFNTVIWKNHLLCNDGSNFMISIAMNSRAIIFVTHKKYFVVTPCFVFVNSCKYIKYLFKKYRTKLENWKCKCLIVSVENDSI